MKTHITLSIIALALFLVATTSCRTIRGAAQDIQHAGSHLERAANDHSH
jgi:predicted small secreted protein